MKTRVLGGGGLRAVDIGVTFLDTADMYGSGSTDEIVSPRLAWGGLRQVAGRSSGPA